MKDPHKNLHAAKSAKADEFYTRLSDIRKELAHYTDHFRNKVVYCNCDDPEVSSFFEYFVSNFEVLGLKRLIASCYKPSNGPLFYTKEEDQATYAIYEGGEIEVLYLEGDGDFRSEESIEILQQADIVVTNPPFSLFRRYMAQLIRYKKQFLIVGSMNAITYKETFKLIKGGKLWQGVNALKLFKVPQGYEPRASDVVIEGQRFASFGNILWFTNMEHSKRREEIPLTKTYNEEEYPTYDNYNAIEVSRVADIPCDHFGPMGVPITFLDKWNPNQFDVVKFRKGDDGKDLSVDGKYPYFRILIRRKNSL